jgi:hypothetical protein
VHSAGQTVPSTDQSRAEGNNTECVGKKRFNGQYALSGFADNKKKINPDRPTLDFFDM